MKTFIHVLFGFIIGTILVSGIFLFSKDRIIPFDYMSKKQIVFDQAKELSTTINSESKDRLEFTTTKNTAPFFLEKRIYLYTGKEDSYVDVSSDSVVKGKVLFDIKNNKSIIVTRKELMGEDFWGWTIPEGKKYEITAIYGDIPGDGDITSRENIYIVTDIKEM